MTNEEELAQLKVRVAELEAKNKPPEPFVPEPFQKWDPTAGMSMPRSVLMEMAAAVPDSAMKGIVHEQRTSSVNQGPSAAGVGGTVSAVHVNPGLQGSHRGSGWREAAPLQPPPGINYVDQIAGAFAARDRVDAIEDEAKRIRIAQVMNKASEPK
jgi:hypothetical protein